MTRQRILASNLTREEANQLQNHLASAFPTALFHIRNLGEASYYILTETNQDARNRMVAFCSGFSRGRKNGRRLTAQ